MQECLVRVIENTWTNWHDGTLPTLLEWINDQVNGNIAFTFIRLNTTCKENMRHTQYAEADNTQGRWWMVSIFQFMIYIEFHITVILNNRLNQLIRFFFCRGWWWQGTRPVPFLFVQFTYFFYHINASLLFSYRSIRECSLGAWYSFQVCAVAV